MGVPSRWGGVFTRHTLLAGLMRLLAFMLNPSPRRRATVRDLESDPWIWQYVDVNSYDWHDVLPNSGMIGMACCPTGVLFTLFGQFVIALLLFFFLMCRSEIVIILIQLSSKSLRQELIIIRTSTISSLQSCNLLQVAFTNAQCRCSERVSRD